MPNDTPTNEAPKKPQIISSKGELSKFNYTRLISSEESSSRVRSSRAQAPGRIAYDDNTFNKGKNDERSSPDILTLKDLAVKKLSDLDDVVVSLDYKAMISETNIVSRYTSFLNLQAIQSVSNYNASKFKSNIKIQISRAFEEQKNAGKKFILISVSDLLQPYPNKEHQQIVFEALTEVAQELVQTNNEDKFELVLCDYPETKFDSLQLEKLKDASNILTVTKQTLSELLKNPRLNDSDTGFISNRLSELLSPNTTELGVEPDSKQQDWFDLAKAKLHSQDTLFEHAVFPDKLTIPDAEVKISFKQKYTLAQLKGMLIDHPSKLNIEEYTYYDVSEKVASLHNENGTLLAWIDIGEDGTVRDMRILNIIQGNERNLVMEFANQVFGNPKSGAGNSQSFLPEFQSSKVSSNTTATKTPNLSAENHSIAPPTEQSERTGNSNSNHSPFPRNQ